MNMIRGIDGILLYSHDGRKLADFYKEKVGLRLTSEIEMGNDKEVGFTFEMKNGFTLWIMDHSKIKGANIQPERYMINFEVDNIQKEFDRMVKMGVKKIQDVCHVEGYGMIATFEDSDGNYFQIVQIRPTEESELN